MIFGSSNLPPISPMYYARYFRLHVIMEFTVQLSGSIICSTAPSILGSAVTLLNPTYEKKMSRIFNSIRGLHQATQNNICSFRLLNGQFFSFLRPVLFLEESCKPGNVSVEKLTFERYASYVVALKEHNGLKPKTAERYKDMLKRINAEIGPLELQDIRPDHLILEFN